MTKDTVPDKKNKSKTQRESKAPAAGFHCSGRDITDRKRVEEELKTSEEKYRALFESSPESITILNLDGKIIDANPATCKIGGHEKNELIGRHFSEFGWIDWEKAHLLPILFAKIINGEKVESLQLTKTVGSGDKKWIEVIPYLLKKDDKPIAVQIISRDITDRKKAEDALIENESKFRVLFENASEGIIIADIETKKFTYVNPSICDMLGYTSESFLKMGVPDIHPPDKLDFVLSEFEQLGSGKKKKSYEIPFKSKDGKTLYFNINVAVFAINEKNSLAGFFTDVTELKRTADELKESKAKYIALFEGITDAVLVHYISENGMPDKIIEANDVACKMLGYTREELLNMGIRDIDASESPVDVQDIVRKLLSGEDVLFEQIHKARDGRSIPVEVHAQIFSFRGEPAILSTVRDISDRKQASQKLEQSENRYRFLYEESPISLWEEDLSEIKKYFDFFRQSGVDDLRKYLDENPQELIKFAGMAKVIDVNKATLEMYKAKSKEEFKEGLNRVFTEKSFEIFKDEIVNLYNGNFEFSSEAVNKDFEGKEMNILIKSFTPPEYRSTLEKVIIAIIDITEFRRAEKEILKAQKLESVGLLAGGIAHDFNNILTALWGNIQLAMMNIAEGTKSFKLLKESERACIRAKELTHQLLTFAKGGAPIKTAVSIDSLTKDTCEFAIRGAKSKCRYTLAENLFTVEADEGQLNQVFSNIVINADQSMPEGGIIDITAHNYIVDDKNPDEQFSLVNGRYVKISFVDSGLGISKDHLGKIFDPYFTTKQKGSGLGLATCFSIIKKHGGHICVESELRKGTTVHILLPASQRKVELPNNEEIFFTGHGKILVMDDETHVQEVCGKMLKHLGYTVEFADNGEEAVAMFSKAKQSNKPFDAVILDLTIPGGMGGKKCIELLLEIDPDVKAIVSSGYSTDKAMSEYNKYGFKGILPKPFKLALIGEAMNRLLGGCR